MVVLGLWETADDTKGSTTNVYECSWDSIWWTKIILFISRNICFATIISCLKFSLINLLLFS